MNSKKEGRGRTHLASLWIRDSMRMRRNLASLSLRNWERWVRTETAFLMTTGQRHGQSRKDEEDGKQEGETHGSRGPRGAQEPCRST